jgi:23S rRNA (guanosine2251-2'-O)-methyltransferase
VLEYLAEKNPAQKLILSSGLTPDSKIQEILRLANEENVPLFQLPRQQIDDICNSRSHQGVVLYSEEYRYSDLATILGSAAPIIVLDHITDPQNLGAIIRSAAAFNANIVLPNARSASVNATVWKTSAGNALKTKIAQVANLNNTVETLQKAGYFVVGLDGEAEIKIDDPIVLDNPRIAIVAGNEGTGLSALTAKKCDVLAKIPTAVESLNVAQAVTVTLYQISAILGQ